LILSILIKVVTQLTVRQLFRRLKSHLPGNCGILYAFASRNPVCSA